jgi:Bacteriocin-protection, YdeI or OmpD-Associated
MALVGFGMLLARPKPHPLPRNVTAYNSVGPGHPKKAESIVRLRTLLALAAFCASSALTAGGYAQQRVLAPDDYWKFLDVTGPQISPDGTAVAHLVARSEENKSAIYSYEQRPADLVEPYASILGKNPAARQFFEKQTPSYRRAATWWVVSAKKEDTRLKRASTLAELSAKRQMIPQFIRKSASK